MTNEERIRANAELVIQTFSEQDLGYNRGSVEWLDGYIERNRENWDAEKALGLGGTLGSFFGECIRENFGGEWKMTEHGLSIEFSGGNGVFPFNKINKHIVNGSDDSIASLYNSIETLMQLNGFE